MLKAKSLFASLLPACCIALVFTVAPVDSTYTGGIIGAGPLCAQEDPVALCTEAWEDIVSTHSKYCPKGTTAHCQVACDRQTGELGHSSCICAQQIQ